MLRLRVSLAEKFDEEKQEFIVLDDYVLKLEHSLAALSKWESEYEKPFLDQGEKTNEELMGYVRAMCVDPEVPPEIFDNLTAGHLRQITEYIDSKQTATWFTSAPPKSSKRTVFTSELIYYWLTAYQIPWEAENWHLNRLFTLIRVFNEKNADPKKQKGSRMSADERRELNRKRREQYGTRG